jgi:sulfite exporter TauE/SafE
MKSESKYRPYLMGALTLVSAFGVYAGFYVLRLEGIDFRDLFMTDGDPHSISVISIFAYSLVFGLKHALEPDHLAAVSTITVEHQSLVGSSLVGAIWGVGHTLSLLLAGFVVILLGFDLREEYLAPVEAVVALMLIGLGARALWTTWRERNKAESAEQRATHVHKPMHQDHSHGAWKRIGVRPLLIGMVHGLAGSAALLLLLIPVIPSTALKIVYILVFGLGSIAGMVIMSCMVGLPTHLMSTRFLKLKQSVRALAGVFSLGFGFWLLRTFF